MKNKKGHDLKFHEGGERRVLLKPKIKIKRTVDLLLQNIKI